MVQVRKLFCGTLKAAGERFVAAEFTAQKLQCLPFAAGNLFRQVDGSRAALAEFALDAVSTADH